MKIDKIFVLNRPFGKFDFKNSTWARNYKGDNEMFCFIDISNKYEIIDDYIHVSDLYIEKSLEELKIEIDIKNDGLEIYKYMGYVLILNDKSVYISNELFREQYREWGHYEYEAKEWIIKGIIE